MNDILMNKVQSIHRCIRRARDEYEVAPADFRNNFTRQDAAILNVIRACDSAIDLANHLIRTNTWGVPVSSADSFRLLHTENVISLELSQQMRRMIGFRNLAVHQYAELDMAIVESVIVTDLNHLIELTDKVLEHVNGRR